jgi:nucleoside 2-deoxyribosyltransferase
MPEVISAVEEFKADLSREFIVFDPYTISEKKLDYLAKSAFRDGKEDISIEASEDDNSKKISIRVADIKDVMAQVDQQIISRDLQLIDQSETVIAYVAAYPNGDPVHSAGTQKEVTYARELGKDVYYIWTPKKDPGPFEKDAATQIFRSVEEARQRLKEMA